MSKHCLPSALLASVYGPCLPSALLVSVCPSALFASVCPSALLASVCGPCFLALCLLCCGAAAATANAATGDFQPPPVRIVPERLPDMTMPRSGHSIFYANGELTITGGHTTNFVTTPTAEYYSDGKWHPMTMAYSHDNGFAIVLRPDEVIIGGGHDEPLGVGQTFLLERYKSETHTFEGFGCLDRRRVLASATQLSDGRVIIAGNHYANDAIGCYDGNSQVQHVKDVVQARSNPYLLRTANDDVLIISGHDQFDKHPDTVWVDRLKGDAFRVPLLEQWYPVYLDLPFSSDACCIGKNAYLLAATDKNGQWGIIMLRDTTFSVLPTACPIPMRGPFGPIVYQAPVVVDSLRQRGYVMGVDSTYHHQYILSIDYAQQPAALTLYYTDSIAQATSTVPIVTPDGDLILAGGNPCNNYKPLSVVWLYHFGTASPANASLFKLRSSWLWLVMVMVVIAALAYIIVYTRKRKNKAVADEQVDDQPLVRDTAQLPANEVDAKTAELMERICQLMDEEKLYLNSDLKLQNVAERLGTNSTYVSECINSVRGQSYSQFVNTYRINHAQELLRQQSDMKTAAVASASGFSTEVSFFRNFKAVTGMTPREWLTKNVSSHAEQG